jgi:hypothetical protein
MPRSHWKDALWNLLDVLSLRRLTARVALSAGLIGLAGQAGSEAGAQPRVPVTPAFTPEATMRKFKGKYVLKRRANSFFIHLAGHQSHSSHSSHASHASHSSGSHYSGSHFSSSVAPPSVPATTPAEAPAPAPPPRNVVARKPLPLLREDFRTGKLVEGRWTVGVIATPPETFDPAIDATQTGGALRIECPAHKSGTHFGGYVSTVAYDLKTASAAAEVRRAATGGVTIFAVAIDDDNWLGFRIERGHLSIESHTQGKITSKSIPYDATQHRFLRLRTSNVAPVVAWETSADGTNWNPEYVETTTIDISALHIALSAGTTKSVDSPTAAIFDNVIVERKP